MSVSASPFGLLHSQLDDLRKTGVEARSIQIDLMTVASRLRYDLASDERTPAERAAEIEEICRRLRVLFGS